MYRFGLKIVILVEKSQLINIAHNSKYCSEKKNALTSNYLYVRTVITSFFFVHVTVTVMDERLGSQNPHIEIFKYSNTSIYFLSRFIFRIM